ncbi:glycosyltransferase [Frateuria aurantia]
MSILPPSQGKGLRIQLIAHDNGFGLSRDLQLLAHAIQAHGHQASIWPLEQADEVLRWKLGRGWRAHQSHLAGWTRRILRQPPFDLSIMFEHLWPAQLGLARRTLALPNPEWFDAKDRRHLGQIDAVWAKTHEAARLFEAMQRPVHYIGFSSDDCLDPTVPRQPGFFHLAGGSPRKGTERLLALWRRHPEWPRLTVVQRRPTGGEQPSNIDIRDGYLELAELRRLQNSHLIHLCPSEAEGYGHYLVEAMSVGAVVVTTDAAPMNELVNASRGRLLAAHRGTAMGLVNAHPFDESAMEAVIEELRYLDAGQLADIGRAGRQWFLANQQRFQQRVGEALTAAL